MFRNATGLHPIRAWSGYDPSKVDEQAKAPKRRPKVGTPEERDARARMLLAERANRPKHVHIRSGDRMSNRQWHAHSKPHWWIRSPSGAFVKIPGGWQRGDAYLDTTIEVPRSVKSVAIGVGPNNRYGIRETVAV